MITRQTASTGEPGVNGRMTLMTRRIGLRVARARGEPKQERRR